MVEMSRNGINSSRPQGRCTAPLSNRYSLSAAACTATVTSGARPVPGAAEEAGGAEPAAAACCVRVSSGWHSCRSWMAVGCLGDATRGLQGAARTSITAYLQHALHGMLTLNNGQLNPFNLWTYMQLKLRHACSCMLKLRRCVGITQLYNRYC